MEQIPNPLKVRREAAGLTRNQLAAIIGIGYHGLASAEIGQLAQIPPRWFPALERAGINAPSLAAEYLDWRAAQARTVAGF